MTPEEAMKTLETIQGPEGIPALLQEIKKQIDARKQQFSVIQGEINAFNAMERTLTALTSRWFGPQVDPNSVTNNKSVSDEAGKRLEEFNQEKAQRMVEGKCTFRSRTEDGIKWCERTLRSKKEREHGYCKIHMHEMDIE